MELNITKEFSSTPGGRYKTQGSFSGEEFRDGLLKTKYNSLKNGEKLTINFDGGYGYGTGFLEESFGGLVRDGYDGKELLENINFISNDNPDVIIKVIKFIKEEMERNNKKVKTYKSKLLMKGEYYEG